MFMKFLFKASIGNLMNYNLIFEDPTSRNELQINSIKANHQAFCYKTKTNYNNK